MGDNDGKKQASWKEAKNGEGHEEQLLSADMGHSEDWRKGKKDPSAA
jgi:hypothetical protein